MLSTTHQVMLATAVALLATLLFFEKKGSTAGVLAAKTPLSALFLAAALTLPAPNPQYFHWILAGLVCGLVGDLALALPGRVAFRIGLAAFLAGHLCYVAAFWIFLPARFWPPFIWLPLAAGALVVWFWLKPHLGKMKIPVALYIVVITIMMGTGWLASITAALPAPAGWLIFPGALMFYFSDLFVARTRFVAPGFINRLLGLPMYYAGQFLLAFSVAAVG